MMRRRARIRSGTIRPLVEPESMPGEPDHVAPGERVQGGADSEPVDLGAVGGSEILDPDLIVGAPDQGMAPAHLLERKYHVGVAGSSHQGAIGPDVERGVAADQTRPRRDLPR